MTVKSMLLTAAHECMSRSPSELCERGAPRWLGAPRDSFGRKQDSIATLFKDHDGLTRDFLALMYKMQHFACHICKKITGFLATQCDCWTVDSRSSESEERAL